MNLHPAYPVGQLNAGNNLLGKNNLSSIGNPVRKQINRLDVRVFQGKIERVIDIGISVSMEIAHKRLSALASAGGQPGQLALPGHDNAVKGNNVDPRSFRQPVEN